MSADTVANAGRFYGLGGVLRRSLDAAGGALVAELESIQARTTAADPSADPDPEPGGVVAAPPPDPADLAFHPAPEAALGSTSKTPPDRPSAAGGPPRPDQTVDDGPGSSATANRAKPTPAPRPEHRLTEDQAALLETADTIVIAANWGSRGPQLTTSWFHWDGQVFRISSTRTGLRADLLRADPRVALYLEDPTTGQMVIAEGVAELCEGPEAGDETRPILAKYLAEDQVDPAWAELNAAFDRIVIRVPPDRLLFTRTEGLAGRPARRPRDV